MKISHGLEYAVTRLLTWLVQILPGRIADMVAFVLGRLSYAVLTSRRRVARENLRRAFKDEKSPGEIEQLIKAIFLHTSRTIVEFARQPVFTHEKILKMFTSDGREYLDQVLAGGKGAMLISGHLGNWELIGGWIAALGYPLDFLVGHQHNELVNDLLISFRRSLGVGIIPVGVAARGVIKSLRSNRFVAVVSDQHAPSGGVVVHFFGRPAATPKGPAAFAVKVGCPIVFGACIRKGYNRHHAIAYPPIYPPQTGDTEKDIVIMSQAYSSLLEACIREYPDQWLWTHRRWKLD
ncbi:MAG: lysophospholipid acyltransferase family protein [Candidatus Zixiibacteriota bacterium]|nr:MAG: lysophospholipid acyltransferase family protein [candidate division Zixibacteria bacterium]